MSEKKELDQKELEKVAGGRTFSNSDISAYKAEYNKEMSCDDCQINEKYLFVSKNDPSTWIFGSIYNSYEKWAVVEYTRFLDIIVMDGNKIEVTNSGGTFEINASANYHTYRK